MRVFLLATMALSVSLGAQEVCPKCERIREYNKTHPGDFEYYDDYLKSEAAKKDKTESSNVKGSKPALDNEEENPGKRSTS